MVVLSRKSRESVVVGAANPFERLLKVTVLEIGVGQVGTKLAGTHWLPNGSAIVLWGVPR